MCEINIDYSEYNDIETIENDKLLDSINLFIGKLTTLIENSERTINVYKGIDVAIIGKPNSGKSSLFNSLLEQEKAIVTNVEGTTRDVLDGEFQIGGILFRILDTAGIRNTKNKIENIGILKSIETIKKAKVILNIIDPTNDKYDDIYESKIKNLITENKVYINVVNKIDICSKEILKKYSNCV
jgi:ferrous iron transport protein B